ncbi:MAG: hypothetical protein AAF092_10595 [Pseudomonadota bacterium]
MWDIDRDALLFDGSDPVIAHPPCRGWGRMKHFAKPLEGELDLGRHAVKVVRRNGGVVEHPEGSTLWRDQGMPRPVEGADKHGGYTLLLNQCDFGHRAQKPTWLYVVGIDPADIPAAPAVLTQPQKLLTSLNQREREATPAKLAMWLIDIASCIDRRGQGGLVEPAQPGCGPAGARIQLGKHKTAAAGQLQLGL